MTEGFSETELRDFCFDTPEFRPVHHELADLSGKATIVRHLLEYADRRDLLASLLDWAKIQNLAKYTEHQPYFVKNPTPASPSTSSGRGSPPASSPPRPLRVFLCHASADKSAVRDLYQHLSQEGFIQPWLDEEDLVPGQDWDTEIRKAVRACHVVLVCLSSHSVTKAGYVQKEIKFALDIADEQLEGTIFLIPLRLEPCDVPERLQRWHWANLFETKGYERLLRALRQRADAINVTLRPMASESSSTPAILESSRTITTFPSIEKPPESWGTLHSVQRDIGGSPSSPPDRLTIIYPIHLELVRVPAGEFLMGSEPAKHKLLMTYVIESEQPQHHIYVSEFYIGKYPITNEQYASFVRATNHRLPKHWSNGQSPTDKEDHPVVNVSWDDAVAFCEWLSRQSGHTVRLPTEAEWEKAARGTDGRIYPWGMNGTEVG